MRRISTRRRGWIHGAVVVGLFASILSACDSGSCPEPHTLTTMEVAADRATSCAGPWVVVGGDTYTSDWCVPVLPERLGNSIIAQGGDARVTYQVRVIRGVPQDQALALHVVDLNARRSSDVTTYACGRWQLAPATYLSCSHVLRIASQVGITKGLDVHCQETSTARAGDREYA